MFKVIDEYLNSKRVGRRRGSLTSLVGGGRGGDYSPVWLAEKEGEITHQFGWRRRRRERLLTSLVGGGRGGDNSLVWLEEEEGEITHQFGCRRRRGRLLTSLVGGRVSSPIIITDNYLR